MIPSRFEIDEENLEKTRLCQLHFLSLPADCQKILKMFLRKSQHERNCRISWDSKVDYAKTRKYLCKNMLRKKILNDPTVQNVFLHYE